MSQHKAVRIPEPVKVPSSAEPWGQQHLWWSSIASLTKLLFFFFCARLLQAGLRPPEKQCLFRLQWSTIQRGAPEQSQHYNITAVKQPKASKTTWHSRNRRFKRLYFISGVIWFWVTMEVSSMLCGNDAEEENQSKSATQSGRALRSSANSVYQQV